MKIVAKQHHRQATELDDHVLAFGDVQDRRLPGPEDLVAPICVDAEPDRTAAMVQDDALVREGARQVGELRNLRMEQPGIERQPQRAETGKAFAELRIGQEPLRPRRVGAGHRGVRVPGRGMADAAVAAVAGLDLRFEHGFRLVTEQEIGVADDRGVDGAFAIAAARRLRRDAVGELDFADRFEGLRAARAIHRAAIDVDGSDDVVARGEVVGELLEQVAAALAVPQMMVCIDDTARRIDDVLAMEREPVGARLGVQTALGHDDTAGNHHLLPSTTLTRATRRALVAARKASKSIAA
jgi:hypothetical protein